MNKLILNSNLPNPILEKKGRLHYEVGVRKTELLAEILAEVHKAAIVMGLNSLDAERSAMTVTEAVKKLLETYPTAWVTDIKKAIQMASFGEIKTDDQLHTISAYNIFNWYRELRINHSDKLTEPMAKVEPQEEMTNERKMVIMINAFKEFLEDFSDDASLRVLYYNRFEKLGYIQVDKERKIQMMVAEIEKIVQHYPTPIFQDHNLRWAANRFKEFWQDQPDKSKVSWSTWQDNPVIRFAKSTIKQKLVAEAMKKRTNEQMMADFKKQIRAEYDVEK